jgi:cytochrome c-type biogenesis protein CcmF
VIAGIALLAAGAGSSRIGVIAYTFSVFVLASIVLEFARGTAARKALGGLGWAAAFSSLVARNRRRYGGYVVHASVVLLAIGITGASAYETVRESRLKPGQSMTVAGDRLVFRGFHSRTESNHRAIRALVDVYRGDKYLGRYTPGKNQYFAEDQVSNEVSIRHDLLTGGDLFLIADQVNSDGSVDLKALQKPLVNLLWLAGFVFVGGALIALWPDAREERRLAERYAGATVRA